LFGIATPDKNVEGAIGYPRGYLTFLLAFAWNSRSAGREIPARASVEYVLDLPWNTQTGQTAYCFGRFSATRRRSIITSAVASYGL
jgi:hypothetical protein